jgi:urea transporter
MWRLGGGSTIVTTTTKVILRQLRKEGNVSSSFVSNRYFKYGSFCWYSSTNNDDDDDDEVRTPSPTTTTPATTLANKSFLSSVSRGIGQVIFCNSPIVGGVIVGSLALADPYLATLATLGCMSSTLSSNSLSYLIHNNNNNNNNNNSAIQQQQQQLQIDQNDGLYGFNGCLVGCATAVFVAPLDLMMMTTTMNNIDIMTPILMKGMGTTIVASAFIPFVSAALKPLIATPYTLSFNIVTLTMLLHMQPFRPIPSTNTITTTTTNVMDTTILSMDPILTTTATAATTTTTTVYDIADLLVRGTVSGISQIFVVDSIMTGMSLIMGTTLVLTMAATTSKATTTTTTTTNPSLLPPPMAIGHMCGGAFLGAATAACTMNVPWNEITSGLWSYNSALTSLAIAIAVQPTSRTTMSSSSSSKTTPSSLSVMALSSGGAFATTWVMGAFQPIFAGWNTPCLTLPFCLTMCFIQWTDLLKKSK